MVEYETDPRSHSVYEVTEVLVEPLNKKKRTPLHLAFTPPQVRPTKRGRKGLMDRFSLHWVGGCCAYTATSHNGVSVLVGC
jgi:hypothetical protein